MGIERVGLEHHGEAAGVRRHVVDDLAVDQKIATGDLLEAGDHAQQGGFAATRRSDKDDELPILDREIDALDDVDGAVAFAHVLQCHGGHDETLT